VAGDHEKKDTSVIVCDKTPAHAWEMTRCSVQMAADTCDDQDRMEAMVPTSVPAGQHGRGDVACLAEPAPPAGLRGHVERSRRLRQALADVPMQIPARSSLLKMAALQDGSREGSQRQYQAHDTGWTAEEPAAKRLRWLTTSCAGPRQGHTGRVVLRRHGS
jgi:hypothetical protein